LKACFELAARKVKANFFVALKNFIANSEQCRGCEDPRELDCLRYLLPAVCSASETFRRQLLSVIPNYHPDVILLNAQGTPALGLKHRERRQGESIRILYETRQKERI